MTLEVKRWLAGFLAVTAAVVGKTIDKIGNAVSLGGVLVLSILLLAPVRSSAEDRDVAWSGNG
uniref:hypothetical protein n=1 Tax=Paractinoplanes polyasparticus TaxID=2856853 RepID=UPI001C858DE8|nr:hypothetical protein [Actinoplanes polyasparticus]